MLIDFSCVHLIEQQVFKTEKCVLFIEHGRFWASFTNTLFVCVSFSLKLISFMKSFVRTVMIFL